MAPRRAAPTSGMVDSDSEGNEDWTPSDIPVAPVRESAYGRPDPSTRRRAAMPETSQDANRRIRLNVKAPSRLRHVTNEADDDDDDSEVIKVAPARQPLSRSSKKAPIIDEHSQSDEEEEDDEEEVEDAEGSDEEEEEEDEDEEVEEEGEEDEEEAEDADGSEDEDGDTDMTPAPPPMKARTIKLSAAAPKPRKFTPERTLKISKVASVEEKEIRMSGTGASDEEEELSSPEPSDDDPPSGSDSDGQPPLGSGLDTIRAASIGSDELGSDSDLDSNGTPDASKQTRRQRGADENELMALSNEAQKKKHFTAEQITMRKTEMARRRKDLSEKRNEQEKLDTLDRLLHKRAPVRRSKAQMMADAEREEFGTPGGEEGEEMRAKEGFVRTITRAGGSLVGMPIEWDGKYVGSVFEGSRKQSEGLKVVGGSRMVQEVE